MSQRYIVLVFVTTVLLLCGAAYAAGRLLLPPSQAELRVRPAWTPPGATATSRPVAMTATVALPGSTPTPAGRPAVVSTPGGAATRPPPPTNTPPPTATPSATPATPAAAFVFDLAQAVRHSSGDCPGAYILGRVTDAQGHPLANVRLWLTDEYGNQQAQTTKSGIGEVGRYDFPLFGPPRRFYLSVVDVQGRQLSPVIEIPHGVGPASQATCHWADWRRR